MRSWGVRSSALLAAGAVVVLSIGVGASPAKAPHDAPMHLPAARAHDRAALLPWLAAHHSRSPRLLDRSLVPAGSDGHVGAASSSTDEFVVPKAIAGTMPDVTGDHVDDVFEVTYSPRTYLVRDGRTGRVLWHRDASGMYDALYARLGSPVRLALAVQVVSTTNGVDHTGVAALDARTGRTLWQTGSPTTGVDATPAGFADVQDTYLADVSARPGRADEVATGTFTGGLTAAGALAAVSPATLDGETGTTIASGLPMVADDVPWVSAVGDLTGDGLGDVVLSANGDERQTQLVDGATGHPLWSKVSPDGTPFGSWAQPLPRADHGTPAVLVDHFGFGDGGLTAFGRTGTQLWARPGVDGFVTGDADHDTVPDLVGIGFAEDGFRITGLSGRTGALRFDKGVAMPDLEGAGSASIGGGPAGDLTGDGITDVLFTVDATGSHPVHESVVTDGRTGGQRDYRALTGYPLGAPLAGRGDALIDVDAKGSAVTLTARTLSRRLWSSRVAASKVIGPAWLDYGRLTPRTRSNDVLASLYGPAGSDIVALSGTTGRVLWRVHV